MKVTVFVYSHVCQPLFLDSETELQRLSSVPDSEKMDPCFHLIFIWFHSLHLYLSSGVNFGIFKKSFFPNRYPV